MGLLKGIFLRVTNFLVFFLVIILLPGLPPYTTFPFTAFNITSTRELKGALEPNFYLDNSERLLEGRVYGPEHLIARNNEIYTGIHGGEIIKLTAEHVTHVTKIGQPCEEIFEESRCGRPLGLAFDTRGNNLLVADAYYGLWEVDLDSGKKKLLVSPHQELPGKEVNRKAKIFNGVTVDQAGIIYWTDSASDHLLQDLVYTALANPSGRVFKYDRRTNTSDVLIDNLFFANGITLSPNEDFLVVVEGGAMRLLKHHLKGAKAGQTEVFVDGLPGSPDNLTPDAEGIWVPLVLAADNEHPSPYSILSNFPKIRFFLARLLSLFEMPFHLVNSYFPNKLCQRFEHFIGHGESVLFLSPKRTTIVRVDWNGNILGSLHGFDKSVTGISHVLEYQGQLLLGSPFNRYLGRAKSPNAAKVPEVKVKNIRYEGAELEPIVMQPKQASPTAKSATTTATTTTTTTTPKPTTTTTTTTTTPKPTTKTTTTTTSRPTTTTTTTTTPKPTTKPTQSTTATTQKPAAKPTAKPVEKPKPTERVPPKEPAPVKEETPSDVKPPQKDEKLKVINKRGQNVEL